MTLLMPCPRCTQPLPVSAAFCRRCGLAVARRAAPAPAVQPRQAGPASPALGRGAAVVAGLLLVGLVVRSRHAVPPVRASPPPTVVPPPGVRVPAVPRVTYSLPVPPSYPPSVTVPPGYAPDPPFREDRPRRRR